MNILDTQHKIIIKGANKQKGAVMISVLVLLVVITLMGLSSMQQGLLTSRVGAAQTLSTMCFQAAEAGLNGVYREFEAQVRADIPITDRRNFMGKASADVATTHCLSAEGVVDGNACGNGLPENQGIEVTMNTRGAREYDPTEKSEAPKFENDLTRGGNYILIYTDAACAADGMNYVVVNTQVWQYESNRSI